MPIIPKKHEMPTQAPEVRAHNFCEVALGYDEETAVAEAQRCLNCKSRPCVNGCPVNIQIPERVPCFGFRNHIARQTESGRIEGFPGCL